MFSRHSADKATPKKDGEDLTTILDATQRADLTLLVAKITDSMRTVLVNNFDANAGFDRSSPSQEETIKDDKMKRTDSQSAGVGTIDKQQKLKEEYERQLSTQEMKDIKEASLKAFDDWKEQVLVRIGEVVNSRGTAKQNLQGATSENTKTEPSTSISKPTETADKVGYMKFENIYLATKNSLTQLTVAQRTLVLHSVLLLMLSLESYSAASRVLMLFLTSSLELPLKTFEQDEILTAKGLLEGAKELSAEEEKNKRVEENKGSLKWKVGLAGAAGAALIGVTGGLAAPLVAAGIGSIMGGLGLGATTAATYLGSLAGSTYLVGGLFGAYGGRMTGTMINNYSREIQDFEFLSIHSSKKTSENEKEAAKHASDHEHKLRLTICISGWLTEKDEIVKPWRVLGNTAEVFALKYELEALLHLGNALYAFVQTKAWAYAKKEIISRTFFAAISSAYSTALWPITLVKTSKVLDNPFSIAMARSHKAGLVLADALINKTQGERPVTLVGYSLGAAVIHSCLISLAKRKAFGLVENAVLVGTPAPADTNEWRMLRAVVSGRLINVYSQNDYVLGWMYRSYSLSFGAAGMQPIEGLTRVENVDVTEEVNGHLQYRYLMGSIMSKIGFEDIDMDAVQKEKKALAKAEEKIQEEQEQAAPGDSAKGKEDEEKTAEQEASVLEKQIEAKTQQSMDAKDISKSQSLTQKASSVLPSMASLKLSDSGAEHKASDQKADDANAEQGEGYLSRATGWMPAIPKSFPSLPGWGKQQTQDQTK